jgi:hypothetical protein
MSSPAFSVVPIADAEAATLRAALPAGGELLELQLVDDALANDAVFTEEMRAPGGPPFRPRSLADALGPARIAEVRHAVAARLVALAGDDADFVLFAKGVRLDPAPDDYVALEARADDLRMNGRVTIFRVPADELAAYDTLFGDFDVVRGVATDRRALSQTLRLLPLHEPVPTTTPTRVLGPGSLSTLAAVVAASRFFFEEIANGTRLRFVSSSPDYLRRL